MTPCTSAAVAAALACVSFAALLAASAPSEAASCLARVAGEGTGMGVGGVGTTKAKEDALANWSRNVRATYGTRFANQASARGVRYDCRSGFVLEVKCAVSAVPCR